jgi:hypothetical protein
MGRYFGIGNSTKKQVVSDYWKSDEFCNCYQVMHQMHWDKTDEIYSCCYDTICEFKYDIENNEMIVIDVTDERLHGGYDDEDVIINNDEEKEENNNKYGFDGKLCIEELNHVPEWVDNKCTKCNFVYDELMLEEYKKKFNCCFFMN